VPALRCRGNHGEGNFRFQFEVSNRHALPPSLADLLVAARHDRVHVRAYARHAATDEEILLRALQEERVIVSADIDFGAIFAAQEAEHPSFILFRETNLLIARDYIAMLLPVLPMLEPELLAGCVRVLPPARPQVAVRRMTVIRHASQLPFETNGPVPVPTLLISNAKVRTWLGSLDFVTRPAMAYIRAAAEFVPRVFQRDRPLTCSGASSDSANACDLC
jgi:predicted nuclease of predicted toxin-antitoxin system